MHIGIAYDLKEDFFCDTSRPDDILEEYDTQETVETIVAALRKLGHSTIKLGGGRRFLELVSSRDPAARPELVFNMAEGRSGRSREAQVPAVCELLGVPYTHSDPLTLALTLDKQLTKRVLASHGVPTAPFCLIEDIDRFEDALLPPFPLIAKPNYEGSSIGIRWECVCFEREALRAQTAALLRDYRQPVLVETFLPGIEVTVAVMGNGPKAHVIGSMEIAPRRGAAEDFIYSLEVKRNYLNEVDYHAPPRLPAAARAALEGTALRAYRALGCRDVARIDLRLDESGRPCLIDVNALPGLDATRSDLPILCAQLGMSFESLIDKIVRDASERTGLSARRVAWQTR